jgi:hypothetical protein
MEQDHLVVQVVVQVVVVVVEVLVIRHLQAHRKEVMVVHQDQPQARQLTVAVVVAEQAQ